MQNGHNVYTAFILRQTDKYLKHRVVGYGEAKPIEIWTGPIMWKTAKILALAAIVISATGCQLLIDNRSRESGAVVVVPSDEWDSLRQASLATSQTPVSTETTDPAIETPVVKIEPTPGSNSITFTSYTGASLGGCATLGIIELQHRGVMDDAITLLKNEAFRLQNMLIFTEMNSLPAEYNNHITIEARMLTCPLKLARGN